MGLMVLCLVFIPLLLFVIVMFSRGKGTHFIIALSGILFLVCTFVMFLSPNVTDINMPSLIWKIILLLTVVLIFIRSIWDKQYIISIFTFFQTIILVLFEILVSPAEPERYLYYNLRESLLLLSGAVIIVLFVPFIIYCLRKYENNANNAINKTRRFSMGFVLLLSSFAGLMAAKSMTGLFLFWQWQYISGYLLLKAFRDDEGHVSFPQIITFIQQAALTLFLLVSVVSYKMTGSLAMQDFLLGFGKVSELAALVVFISAILMGLLIPENFVPWFDSSGTVPIAGLYLIIYSLIVPYGVLLKFRPLFNRLYNGVISLMILYGSLLVFAGAYFALVSYKNRHSILSLIMCIAGLAVTTVFNNLQSGIIFLSGNPLPLLLIIAGIVLTVAYIILWISFIFTHTGQISENDEDNMLASIIPFNVNFGLMIKIGWVAVTALSLGVSLSCLK